MSYILDALRKADAQRERDPARGIHAQPVTAAAGDVMPARGAKPWLWGAAGLAALVMAALALWPGTPATAPATGAAYPAAAVPAASAAQPGTASAPAAPASMVLPAPAAESAPPVPGPAIAAAPAAARASSTTTEASAGRIVTLAELPADMQRELPKLSIDGGVYSQDASQRLLIVGGQVYGEGAQIAPGLVLEQVRTRAAVLRFRGHRFTVAY